MTTPSPTRAAALEALQRVEENFHLRGGKGVVSNDIETIRQALTPQPQIDVEKLKREIADTIIMDNPCRLDTHSQHDRLVIGIVIDYLASRNLLRTQALSQPQCPDYGALMIEVCSGLSSINPHRTHENVEFLEQEVARLTAAQKPGGGDE